MRNAVQFLSAQHLTRPAPLPLRLLQQIRLWRRHRAQMRALRLLDDRLLSDVGLNRDQLGKSSHPARWDAPPHWTWNG